MLLACGVATLTTLNWIWKRLSKDQLVPLCFAEIGLMLLISTFLPDLREVLLPYVQGIDFFVTLLAVALMFLVIRQDPEIATGILTFMIYVVMVSIIPMPAIFARQTGPYLLDRPFLQIFFFAPLSLFTGGLSYLVRGLRLRISRPSLGRKIVLTGFLSLTVLAVLIRPVSDFKPNPCCVYMTIDDIFIIGWMKDNVSRNSPILIATDPEINTPFVEVALDAGAWILPLTGLETITLDYRTDFSEAALQSTLCQKNIKYIYVSAVNPGFSIGVIEDNKQKYPPIMVLPDSRLYGVNC